MANIRLTWPANPDSQIVCSYEVWEKVNDGFWNLIASIPETFYEFSPSGGVRQWKVRAVNFVGPSEFSEVVEGPAAPTAPGTPVLTAECP